MSAKHGTSAVEIRTATPADAPFLALVEEIASTPPFPTSTWALCLEGTGTTVRDFAEAMYAEDACRWGAAGDFLVIERNGAPVAACAVYEPDEEADRRTFRLERLPAVARRLAWSAAQADSFVGAYEKAWGPSGPWLEPQAPAIIETVAVLPEGRGLGLGRRLIDAAVERARHRGHDAIGVSVITGNEAASRLYESAGFEPFATYHAWFFDGRFPGFTKLIRRLTGSELQTTT